MLQFIVLFLSDKDAKVNTIVDFFVAFRELQYNGRSVDKHNIIRSSC